MKNTVAEGQKTVAEGQKLLSLQNLCIVGSVKPEGKFVSIVELDSDGNSIWGVDIKIENLPALIANLKHVQKIMMG